MSRETTPILFVLASREIFGQVREISVQQGQQRTKRSFIPTMRCGRHQDKVALFVSSKLRDQLVALMASTTAFTCISTGVRLINNDQFGAGTHKLVAPAIRFDKVG